MRVAIIDAQGAGLGQAVIKKARKELGKDIYLIALGTNEHATYNMIKAGADESYTGGNEICSFCRNNDVDSIVGPIGIICSGGIQGEITSDISQAIFAMDCIKYIIPLQKHGIYIPGTRNLEIKEIIEEIILDIRRRLV